MAKPMVITLPMLLLLLDVWPVKRRALREKLPLFAIAAGFAVLTYVGARRMGALAMLEPIPLTIRLQNAVWSVGQYLSQTVLPHGFSIVYPYPRAFPNVGMIALVFIAITAAAIWQRRDRPWILMGWLWFLVGIGPTLGLVQAGVQARADRFTYVAHIGLLLAIVWTAGGLLPSRLHKPAAWMSVLTLAAISHGQTARWRSSEAIFAQALANTSQNWLAEHKYGLALLARNNTAGAEQHLRRAAAIDPRDPYSRFHLGRIAASGRRIPEAVEWFTKTIRLKADYADAHYARASMLAALGLGNEAVQGFDRARALGLTPEWAFQAHLGSGVLLARDGRLVEAERHFRSALQLQPSSVEAQRNLALAQEQLRHTINGKPSIR